MTPEPSELQKMWDNKSLKEEVREMNKSIAEYSEESESDDGEA